jgi:hypothetical protein
VDLSVWFRSVVVVTRGRAWVGVADDRRGAAFFAVPAQAGLRQGSGFGTVLEQKLHASAFSLAADYLYELVCV